MKTCKNCKSPFVQVELSSIIRGYAITDVFRCLILLGPMLSFFYACTNLHPKPPHVRVGGAKHHLTAVDYVLYIGNRTLVSETEQIMLANVEKSCTKEYRDDLPAIWTDATPTLYKALYLQGIAMILPVTSAIAFLVFQKRDTMSSAIALIHFCFEMLSIVLSMFGAYFISDARLCFLGHFSKTLHIPVALWTISVFFAVFYKIGILYCLELYLKHYCKARTFLHRPPTPFEELKSYLQELKELGIQPKVKIEIPEDPTKRDWQFVNSSVKRLLQDVRIQIAELHRDDPLIDDLLKAGKLHGHDRNRHRKREGSATSIGTMGGGGPSVLRIARMMASKNAEYKLLKQHHHHGKGDEENKDDVDVILPGPSSRFDPD